MTTFKRIIIGLGMTAAVLAALVVAMFAFGTPTAPQAAPSSEASAGPAPAGPGTAMPPRISDDPAADDTASPLAIQMPGCVCHSSDPQVVADHATYRISQCFGCHQGGTPEMGR